MEDPVYRVILKFLYHLKIRNKIQKAKQKIIFLHQKMRLPLKFFSVIFFIFFGQIIILGIDEILQFYKTD
jgi:hypothetical protein